MYVCTYVCTYVCMCVCTDLIEAHVYVRSSVGRFKQEVIESTGRGCSMFRPESIVNCSKPFPLYGASVLLIHFLLEFTNVCLLHPGRVAVSEVLPFSVHVAIIELIFIVIES